MDKAPNHTAWGEKQTESEIGTGIIFVTTAGHGGAWLSPARRTEMKTKFPYFVNWLKSEAWWEEDADISIVILAFPEYFTSDTVKNAFRLVQKDKYYINARAGSYWNTLVTAYGEMPPGC